MVILCWQPVAFLRDGVACRWKNVLRWSRHREVHTHTTLYNVGNLFLRFIRYSAFLDPFIKLWAQYRIMTPHHTPHLQFIALCSVCQVPVTYLRQLKSTRAFSLSLCSPSKLSANSSLSALLSTTRILVMVVTSTSHCYTPLSKCAICCSIVLLPTRSPTFTFISINIFRNIFVFNYVNIDWQTITDTHHCSLHHIAGLMRFLPQYR